METFSALPALCAGNSPVAGEFPAQRPVTRSFGVLFDLCLDKWLSKHSTTICKLVDLIPALHQSDCRIPNWVSAKTVLSSSTRSNYRTLPVILPVTVKATWLWEWKPRFAIALVVRDLLIVTSHTNCDVTSCPVVMRRYANADGDEQRYKTSKTQVSLTFCNCDRGRIEIDHLYGLRCRGWYCNPEQHSLCQFL